MNKKLKSCPDCGGIVSIEARACPHCGRKITTRDDKATGVPLGIIVGVIVLVVLAVLAALAGCAAYDLPAPMASAPVRNETQERFDAWRARLDQQLEKLKREYEAAQNLPEDQKYAAMQAIDAEGRAHDAEVKDFKEQWREYGEHLDRAMEIMARMQEAQGVEDMGREALLRATSTPPPTEINVHYPGYQ